MVVANSRSARYRRMTSSSAVTSPTHWVRRPKTTISLRARRRAGGQIASRGLAPALDQEAPRPRPAAGKRAEPLLGRPGLHRLRHRRVTATPALVQKRGRPIAVGAGRGAPDASGRILAALEFDLLDSGSGGLSPLTPAPDCAAASRGGSLGYAARHRKTLRSAGVRCRGVSSERKNALNSQLNIALARTRSRDRCLGWRARSASASAARSRATSRPCIATRRFSPTTRAMPTTSFRKPCAACWGICGRGGRCSTYAFIS